MIVIFSALYIEAAELIRILKLKKESEPSAFARYSNSDKNILLIISGVGPINAAAAVGDCLGRLSGEELSHVQLLNYGSAAGEGMAVSSIYRIVRIVDDITKRTYYPDLIIRSEYPDAVLYSSPKIFKDKEVQHSPSLINKSDSHQDMSGGSDQEQMPCRSLPVLHDMEAAAIYEAASHYIGPDRLHFVKVVSDMGDPAVSRDALAAVMTESSGRTAAFVGVLCRYEEIKGRAAYYGEGRNLEITAKLSGLLKCSVTMDRQLRQLVRYYFLSTQDAGDKLDKLLEEGYFDAKDRREGKKILDDLRKRILA